MRFLVDAQLPPALCRWIGARGHAAMHVFDIGMIAASDSDIAAHAERNGVLLVSKDGDFRILRLPDRFGLLWLRCGNTTNRALSGWMSERWDQIERLLESGERIVEVR